MGPRCVRGLGCLWAGGVCVALGAGGVCVSTHLVCGQRQRRWGESQPGQGQRSVCVCVCVGGGGVGGGGGEQCVVCGVPCVRAGCEPAGWVCVCLGSGCVCARCAGGVCVRVCVWCLGCTCGCGCPGGQAWHRDTARQRTRQCVCSMRVVCVGMCAVCGVYGCVGGWGARAETKRHSQAKDKVHGWIFCIICLCFLSSFITSMIKTTPMKCESATLTSVTS